MPRTKRTSSASAKSTTVRFEARLWQAADALRNNMDAAEYKHVVLGLIFLKYISDAFEAKHAELQAQEAEGANPEDRDEYLAASIFWVPREARWSHLKASAPQPAIGTIVDDAMAAIERDNPSLKGVLPNAYARPGLDKQRLGQLINLVSDIGLGGPEDKARDTLGRVYEYFLSQFASAEGKQSGQFYTPRHVVRVLVEMLAPYKGRVYDPCCGSGGMFVNSERFVEAHRGKVGDISIYGQESNYTTWRLAKMNLAIRGIDAQIAHGDTFHADAHPDLKADYVLANPPFNDSDWRGDLLRDDKRWAYGIPPAGNANFAWVQHFISHLAPSGIAGFVLANGSMSSNQSGEGEIRKNIIEADLVDCMVALPGQLFYSTQIPVCLWFLARDKRNGRFRDRRGETLFIDARKMGTLVDRTHRELTDEDVARVAGAYHAWRGDPEAGEYADVAGFCKSATLDAIRGHDHVLTPGRYVGGAAAAGDDAETFDEKMTRLGTTLREQQVEARRFDAAIAANLVGLTSGWRSPSPLDIRRGMVAALSELYRVDRKLIDSDASERSITHKLAEHLRAEFPAWDVDCEYNRLGLNPKRLPLSGVQVNADAIEARTVFPDIIIHRRGTNENLMVIEVKKANVVADTKDREKVEMFLTDPRYRYRYGFVLKLDATAQSKLMRCFADTADSVRWEDWSDALSSVRRS